MEPRSCTTEHSNPNPFFVLDYRNPPYSTPVQRILKYVAILQNPRRNLKKHLALTLNLTTNSTPGKDLKPLLFHHFFVCDHREILPFSPIGRIEVKLRYSENLIQDAASFMHPGVTPADTTVVGPVPYQAQRASTTRKYHVQNSGPPPQ